MLPKLLLVKKILGAVNQQESLRDLIVSHITKEIFESINGDLWLRNKLMVPVGAGFYSAQCRQRTLWLDLMGRAEPCPYGGGHFAWLCYWQKKRLS